jgi:hypothetical protein
LENGHLEWPFLHLRKKIPHKICAGAMAKVDRVKTSSAAEAQNNYGLYFCVHRLGLNKIFFRTRLTLEFTITSLGRTA